jgi:putative addiction module killer protein
MEVQPLVIKQYVRADGKRPFQDWFDALPDEKARAIIASRLVRLEAGNLGDFKYFDSILELRIDYGQGYRIYCGKRKSAYILLLLAGTKKTQERDIATARICWADYQNRIAGGRTL